MFFVWRHAARARLLTGAVPSDSLRIETDHYGREIKRYKTAVDGHPPSTHPMGHPPEARILPSPRTAPSAAQAGPRATKAQRQPCTVPPRRRWEAPSWLPGGHAEALSRATQRTSPACLPTPRTTQMSPQRHDCSHAGHATLRQHRCTLFVRHRPPALSTVCPPYNQ